VNLVNIKNESAPNAAASQSSTADLVASLIENFTARSVCSREQDYQRFSAELTQVLSDLRNNPAPCSLTQYTNTALSNFEAYQKNTQRHIDGWISQLRGIIRTLFSTIGSMRSDGDGPDLDAIEQQIMELQTIEDLAVARENLELALGKLTKAERARKQEAATQLKRLHDRVLILEDYANTAASPAQSLHDESGVSSPEPPKQDAAFAPGQTLPAKTNNPNPVDPSIDRLTGLPTRDAAEASIVALEANPRNRYVAAFYIQNMQQLNVRFGERIGDELLFLITQRLVSTVLRPSDQIFRWRGPAFVAILDREESFLYVNQDLKRSVEHPFQFEFRSGSLLVFISIAAELLSMANGTAAEHILQLEQYFSSF